MTTPSRRRPVRLIALALLLSGAAGLLVLVLPVPTNDERLILKMTADSEPVTTCLALKTVTDSAYAGNWTETTKPLDLAEAHARARSRQVSLPLDAENYIDNLLKITCRDKATLSTPAFYGNLAFIQITGKREQRTEALRKVRGKWEWFARTIAPIGVIID